MDVLNNIMNKIAFNRKQTTCDDTQAHFLLLWPWLWPDDLDIWTWPEDSEALPTSKVNYLGHGVLKLEQYKQTERQMRPQTYYHKLHSLAEKVNICW